MTVGLGGRWQRAAGSCSQEGVTLVELMVVVAIVAILAAIALPALRGNHEAEFKRAADALLQDLQRTKSLSLSKREEYSLLVLNDRRYQVKAVWPATASFIEPPVRDVTLPDTARITSVKLCADLGPPGCGAASGNAAEIRFFGTSVEACLGNPTTCTRARRSVTIYLQGHRLDGTPDPELSRRIVVFQSTGYCRLY